VTEEPFRVPEPSAVLPLLSGLAADDARPSAPRERPRLVLPRADWLPVSASAWPWPTFTVNIVMVRRVRG
jgi:hypothetical protein